MYSLILFIFCIMVLSMIIPLFDYITSCLLLKKANKDWWRYLLPIYGNFYYMEVFWHKIPGFIFLGCIVCAIFFQCVGLIFIENEELKVIYVLCMIGISLISFISSTLLHVQYFFIGLSFGKSWLFSLGLVFLRPIFVIILLLSNAQYIGPMGKANEWVHNTFNNNSQLNANVYDNNNNPNLNNQYFN